MASEAVSAFRGSGDGVKPEAAPVRARIVLIDDNALFRESLCMNMTEAGFDVLAFESGESALSHLVDGEGADLVLLDWIMPGMNGIEVLKRIREVKRDVPVIFLTELTDQIYEEAALQGGAVDFVEKSRSFSILLRRIKLILQGVKNSLANPAVEASTGPHFVRGDLELRRDTARAFWNGKEITLSITEFKMVDLLATRAGQDVRYRELYDLVHGEGFITGNGAEGYRANVRAFVKRIREKFRTIDENWDVLENYSGFGYRWRDRTTTDPV